MMTWSDSPGLIHYQAGAVMHFPPGAGPVPTWAQWGFHRLNRPGFPGGLVSYATSGIGVTG